MNNCKPTFVPLHIREENHKMENSEKNRPKADSLKISMTWVHVIES